MQPSMVSNSISILFAAFGEMPAVAIVAMVRAQRVGAAVATAGLAMLETVDLGQGGFLVGHPFLATAHPELAFVYGLFTRGVKTSVDEIVFQSGAHGVTRPTISIRMGMVFVHGKNGFFAMSSSKK
jgi:hypothetical protein